MPTVSGSGLIRDVASIPCADKRCGGAGASGVKPSICSRARTCSRPAFCYRIVALDEPPSECTRRRPGARCAAAGAGERAIDSARRWRLDARAGARTAGERAVCRTAHVAGARARQTGQRNAVRAFPPRAGPYRHRGAQCGSDGGRRIARGRSGPATFGTERGASPRRRQHHRRKRYAWPGSAPAQVDVDGAGIGIDLPASTWSRCDECPSAPAMPRCQRRDAAPVMY